MGHIAEEGTVFGHCDSGRTRECPLGEIRTGLPGHLQDGSAGQMVFGKGPLDSGRHCPRSFETTHRTNKGWCGLKPGLGVWVCGASSFMHGRGRRAEQGTRKTASQLSQPEIENPIQIAQTQPHPRHPNLGRGRMRRSVCSWELQETKKCVEESVIQTLESLGIPLNRVSGPRFCVD